jgi:hypothetical protein
MASSLGIALVTMMMGTGVAAHHLVFASPAAKVLSKQRPLIHKIEKQNPNLSEAALMAGVKAYDHLREEGQDSQQLLTIVNFHKPSNKKRFWLINMKSGNTDDFTYVAQGQNTGLNIAKHFSNVPGTHESSIGVYLTGKPYYGIAGYSMHLHGLDKGFNNNVFKRHIVMHGAWFVSKNFAQKYGRIGRTYGCFGLSKKIAPKIIPKIKEGTVMVAYYPNQQWLKNSPYERSIRV